MAETTTLPYIIRPYQPGDEPRMAELVNASRASEGEVVVSADLIRNEWDDPRLDLARDTWAAVNQSGEWIAATEVWLEGPGETGSPIARHIGFTMHPAVRESHAELMEQLFAEAVDHAERRPAAYPNRDYILRAWASASDGWKDGWLRSHDFRQAHGGYTMLHELDEALPPVPAVPGIRIEPWSEARDDALWHALNDAFSTDPDFTPLSGTEWELLYHADRTEFSLWSLAVDLATDQVVGFAIAEVDHEGNAETGRRDGWVTDLAVIPAWRGRKLGRALVMAALHALRDAGMTAAKAGVDSTDPDNATRLYESLGFSLFSGSRTYHRPLAVRR